MKFNKKTLALFGGLIVAMSLFTTGAADQALRYSLQVINGICDQAVNFTGQVKINSITTQAFSYENALTLDDAALLKHAHSNKTLLDTYAQSETDLASAVSQKHAHANAAVLAKFSEAAGKPQYDGQAIGGGGELTVTALGTSGTQTINRATSDKWTLTPTSAVTLATSNFTDILNEAKIAIVNGNGLVTFPGAWIWQTAIPTLEINGVNVIKLQKVLTGTSEEKILASAESFYHGLVGNDTHTKLLVHFEESGFVDTAAGIATAATITPYNVPIFDTTIKKFGVGSLYSDGVKYIVATPGQAGGWNCTSWTLEGWFNMTTATANADILGVFTSESPGYVSLRLNNNTLVNANAVGLSYFGTVGSTETYGTGWHHVAFVYDGTNVKYYFDGVLKYTGATTRLANPTSVHIGAYSLSATGNYDEVRLSNSVRYFSNFTPPIEPFGN